MFILCPKYKQSHIILYEITVDIISSNCIPENETRTINDANSKMDGSLPFWSNMIIINPALLRSKLSCALRLAQLHYTIIDLHIV